MQDKPLFPVGSRVRIAGVNSLRDFMRPQYKYHHPVTESHLAHADEVHEVVEVADYHGGDLLYSLNGLNQLLWLERCLRAEKA